MTTQETYQQTAMTYFDLSRKTGRLEGILGCAAYLRQQGAHELADRMVDAMARKVEEKKE